MAPVIVPKATAIGQPIEPVGDPMLSGIGPASWAERADVPDLTVDGRPKIVPLKADPNFYLEPRDPDPRGMTVVGLDGQAAGTVVEVWVDRSEPQVRYLELEVAGTARTALLPIAFCRFDVGRRLVNVKSIKATHFVHVPFYKTPGQVTLLEEDQIQAFYAGGHLYADPSRVESQII